MIHPSALLAAAFLIPLSAPATVFAESQRSISVRVVDEQGEPVEGAEVRARYLEDVHQGEKVYRVPMELAPPQRTDANGRCALHLHQVSWLQAGLCAHRVELTTDEVMDLYDGAPADPSELERFEREINDRCQRFRSAYQILTSHQGDHQTITLKMAKAIKVTGRVQVGGRPLANAFITIYSPKMAIDELFPRSSPVLTDQAGRFSFYSVPGKLDLARIVVERRKGNRVLKLTDVPSEPTSEGLSFYFDTEVDDYELVQRQH